MRSTAPQVQWWLTASVLASVLMPFGVSPASVAGTCDARTVTNEARSVTWHISALEDLAELDRWCRAVGPPIAVPSPRDQILDAAELSDLVVLTWNAHLFEGDLRGLIADLRDGHLTGGRPVRRFVLLLQELFRRGPEVPPFARDSRSAFAITGGDERTPDARGYAATLGLSMLYVPSMRNGSAVREDRGSAIVSTERLDALFAVELPLERQRRVAVGASIDVGTPEGPNRLHLVSAHLEPLSSPASLWIFGSPRPRQLGALLRVLPTGATVLGGDLNTIQAGAAEEVYSIAREWSRSLLDEDPRGTHRMGRLDYLFFRLNDGWTASTTRVEDKYGSDHHPVLGRIARQRTPQS